MSKKSEIRGVSRRSRRPPSPKTGSLKDNLPHGYKEHSNALNEQAIAQKAFIPKIK